jgi:GTP-binding protein EngB required for normal cell division
MNPPVPVRSGGHPPDRTTLETLLQHLAKQADDQAQPQVHALTARLTARELRVLLVGEAKRGKSTLGNAILGRDLLPTGVRPVTAITTAVEPGSPEHLEVTYLNGRQEQHPVTDLARFVTESENPLNTRKVASVRVVVEDSVVAPAVLVDTPGVGSVFTHNTGEATQAMESMDLAVFVLTADPPISLTERTLLDSVRARAVATFVVLNKVDRLTAAEVEEARAFAVEVTGTERVFSCSARAGLDARTARDPAGFAASGLQDLVDELAARIRDRAEEDLIRSVAVAAGRVAGAALERVSVTKAALTAVIEDRGRDVEMFSQEVSRSDETLTQALASVSWEAREMRRQLDTASADRADRTRRQLLGKLEGLAAHTASEHAERQARQAVVTLIEHDVAAWRNDQLTLIESSMVSLLAREQQHLDRTADDLGAAAHRLLGVDLRPVFEPLPLPDAGAFHFDFSPAVGWNTAVVQGVRRHLPVRWRRKAIARHLHTETLTLVDRQYGRARSDLQTRLEAAHRQLASEVKARIIQQQDALTAALAAATDLKGGTVEQHHAHLADLDARIDALGRLQHELDAPTRPDPAAGSATEATAGPSTAV